MLHEVGVESYYVIINVRRGSVGEKTPAHVEAFNHAILAIKLPEGGKSDSLIAVREDPKLGRLLFFDPTNELTPFGFPHLQQELKRHGHDPGRRHRALRGLPDGKPCDG